MIISLACLAGMGSISTMGEHRTAASSVFQKAWAR